MSAPHLAVTMCAIFIALFAVSCKKAPKATPDVVVVERSAVTLDPNDRAWKGLPEHIAPLLLQDMVDPRLMTPSTSVVHVQAMTDGKDVAFRLSWDDATMNDLPGPAKFTDACAVQFPQKAGPDLPAPQMGEMGRQVEIAFWRASWQAVVDGRGDTIKDIHPNAAVDHYPFEAQSLPPGSPEQKDMALRYSPARAAGNTMSGPRERPVECLIAGGPGTLTPDPTLKGNGKGKYEKGKWAVVISRPLPEVLRATPRSQAAFAVWEGSHQEVGARKMRTGWVPVVREQKKS
ncbi:MAG: ethylbenzene dehydrogenase-related protein [Thermoanaerobaculia bacterium]|nr:ethylbenzene dehydrogenase-related protein [Thermoanaerobaculia bacterium]